MLSLAGELRGLFDSPPRFGEGRSDECPRAESSQVRRSELRRMNFAPLAVFRPRTLPEELERHETVRRTILEPCPAGAEFQIVRLRLAHAYSHACLAPALPAYRRQYFSNHVLPLD